MGYYKLRQLYYKLRQKFITNYEKKLLQITAALIFKKFKIITKYVKFYYILWQFLALLQITANFITTYGRYYKLQRCYKLRRNNFYLHKSQIVAFNIVLTTRKIQQGSGKFRIWKVLIVKWRPYQFLKKFEKILSCSHLKKVSPVIFSKILLGQN